MHVTRQIGRYEIDREIGRGGTAIVYLARQVDLGREVALKELSAFHAGDRLFAERFLREARLGGSLNHPNIVTVYDYFEHDAVPYIAMEYVARGSLRAYDAPLSMAQSLGVLEGMLAGLSHAEARSIVHRDLKPENLMVADDGTIKIADFGIAKALSGSRLDQPHRDGDDGRDAALHGPGAGDGRADRPGHRSLRDRGDRLRAVHGPPAVRQRGNADGRAAAPRQRAGRAADRPRSGARPADLGLDHADAGEAPRGPSGQRRGGLGGARGHRARPARPEVAAKRAAAGRRRRQGIGLADRLGGTGAGRADDHRPDAPDADLQHAAEHSATATVAAQPSAGRALRPPPLAGRRSRPGAAGHRRGGRVPGSRARRLVRTPAAQRRPCRPRPGRTRSR